MAYQIEGGSEYKTFNLKKTPKGQIGAPVKGQKVKYWLKILF